MSLQPRLVWSSRESIRAQLVALLKQLPREESDTRRRIVSLLDIFGSAEDLPLLRELFCDPRESGEVYLTALHAAAVLGLRLSSREFVQLHEGEGLEEGFAVHLEDLLDHARLESFDDVMREALLRLTSSERTRLLRFCSHVPQPPELTEWLFTQWYQVDRHSPDDSDGEDRCDVQVALAYRARPEALQLLAEWSGAMDDQQLHQLLLALARCGREEVGRLAESSSVFRAYAARKLMLPLDALLAYWGEEELLRRLDRRIQEEHVADTVPQWLVKGAPFFPRDLELMGSWDVARRRVLYRRLCDVGTASTVRCDLYRQLREHAPDVATRWALVARRYPGNEELIRDVLEQVVSQAPMPEDRPLLLAALKDTDAGVQVPALSALLTLGEAGAGWVDRLHSLAHAESPKVRVQALAGLVQHGHREWLEPLRRLAVEERDSSVRIEAVQWLGQLDIEDSRPLFLELIADECQPDAARKASSRRHREANWALVALSRRGQEEDLSLLLEVRLKGCFASTIDAHLRFHLARQEGATEEAWPPRWSSPDGWYSEYMTYTLRCRA
ncbi:HEAT repeat [Myxococcus fulvus]|uniref:HEAT repeat n=1 Tax=Myxococcus fulvus TaxID=33 RepID=A0A511T049_MYXFU|nr:HEAT repeat domain-containing protein [Myxococcus fulvus]GEN07514.1 hypothetical protein MFU01_25510 [Myxococcus fulvus]SES88431.1 HEAT repeat [Myxococcus fulvus]